MGGSRRLFLGVDGGQSSTRAVIGDESGRVLSRAVGAPCNRATPGSGEARLRETTKQLLRDTLRRAGLATESEFEAACFGMSGGPDDKRSLLAGLVSSAAVEVTNDAETALDGATGGGPGTVVIAGTGSIALARNRAGKLARCGGWGYVFGDEGGAFDIVRRALREALAAEEGWGPPTELGRALLGATGSGTVSDAMHRFYDPDWPRSRIASLAPFVDEIGARGDGRAQAVLQEAGEALATLAVHAVGALEEPLPQANVYPCGSVFSSSRVHDGFSNRLRAAGLTEGQPAHDAATGALLRAYRARGLRVSLREVE